MNRELPPVVGLAATLDASARAGAQDGTDPTPGSGIAGTPWWGSTFAGGVLNVLGASYAWADAVAAGAGAGSGSGS